MARWDDKSWHHDVHESVLGEDLHYFFIRFKPFSMPSILAAIEEFLSTERLGGVRVFVLFGAFDLLIRVWLHPTLLKKVRRKIEKLPGYETCDSFLVSTVKLRSYGDKDWSGPLSPEVLERLDEDSIRAAQNSDPIIDGFVSSGAVLLLPEGPANTIKFFLSLAMVDDARAQTIVVKQLISFLGTNKSTFAASSVYHGSGTGLLGSILIKAHVNVSEFFKIASLPEWIGETFSHYEPRTQTFLSAYENHRFADGRIGESTFSRTHGSLFVRGLLAELYELDVEAGKLRLIEDTITTHVKPALLTRQDQRDRRFFREYLLAVTSSDVVKWRKCVANFFIEVEAYLNDNLDTTVMTLTGFPQGALRHELKLPADRRSLGDVLRLYEHSIARGGLVAKLPILAGAWDEIAKLRNDVQHGAVKFQTEWHEHCADLAKHLPRLRELIAQIELLSGQAYLGS